jgi:hypothetical protein
MVEEAASARWLSCSLGQWMIQQRAVLSAMQRGGSLDWTLAAADFTRIGKTDHLGRAPTPAVVKETWRRILDDEGL